MDDIVWRSFVLRRWDLSKGPPAVSLLEQFESNWVELNAADKFGKLNSSGVSSHDLSFDLFRP